MAGEEGEARLVELGGGGCAGRQTKAHLLLRLSHKSREQGAMNEEYEARIKEQGARSRELGARRKEQRARIKEQRTRSMAKCKIEREP